MKNKTIKLYSHITDGGASYLMDTYIEYQVKNAWTNEKGREGVINDKTKYVVRLDGQPELTIR
jgi:hypothetical protein